MPIPTTRAQAQSAGRSSVHSGMRSKSAAGAPLSTKVETTTKSPAKKSSTDQSTRSHSSPGGCRRISIATSAPAVAVQAKSKPNA